MLGFPASSILQVTPATNFTGRWNSTFDTRGSQGTSVISSIADQRLSPSTAAIPLSSPAFSSEPVTTLMREFMVLNTSGSSVSLALQQQAYTPGGTPSGSPLTLTTVTVPDQQALFMGVNDPTWWVGSPSASTPVGIPSGGATGQVLQKASAASYDTTWGTLPTPPAGGSAAPLGTIVMFPSGTAPTASGTELWAKCDGTAISRSTYAALFAILGTTFGAGDGSTTFNLPDFRGRVPVSIGTGPGGQVWNLNTKLGAETHVLSVGELAAHTHGNSGVKLLANNGFDTTGISQGTPGNTPVYPATDSTGSNSPHNNLQPSIGINFIIKIRD